MSHTSTQMCSTKIDFSQQGDNDLLQAVLLRGEQAWVELLRRYRGLIYRCIGKVTAKYSAVIDRDDVEEIFSNVCLNLLRDDMHKLRAYRAERGSKLGSWIGLIAINTAYDYLRALSRRPRLEALETAAEPAALSLSPLEVLCERERWLTLNSFVTDFSPRDRRFLELYYSHGLEPEEIAEEMGISIKTVYSKKNKVLTRLIRLAQMGQAGGTLAPAARIRGGHGALHLDDASDYASATCAGNEADDSDSLEQAHELDLDRVDESLIDDDALLPVAA